MEALSAILKKSRTKLGLTAREVAQSLDIDATLLSRFESGTRFPNRGQIAALAGILKLKEEEMIVAWVSSKIIQEYAEIPFALEGLLAAEEQFRYQTKSRKEVPKSLQKLLKEIDALKSDLDKFRQLDSYRIAEALDTEYTFESNRIEGNTLSLRETDLVVHKGLTISGKSMREHLEAINHTDAIIFIKELVGEKAPITESKVLQIHNLVLRGIDSANAGKYRQQQVYISGSTHTPPAPFLVPKQMEDFFLWYKENRNILHPIVLAAEVHERLVTIHPFIDGNGRSSRLLMNLILLQNGYVIANIKGDIASRQTYYSALEKVQTGGSKKDFILFVAKTELDCLKKYIQLLKGES